MEKNEKTQFLESKVKYLESQIQILQSAAETNRQKLNDFESLFENSPDIIIRLDPQLHFSYLNAAAAKTLGHNRRHYLGKKINEVGFAEDKTGFWIERLRETIKSGQQQKIEFGCNDHYWPRYFDARLIPESADGNNITSIMIISRDISDRKLMEVAVRDAKRELEKRVAERTTELALSNEQLRKEVADRKRVEEALRQSEEKYRFLFNNANDAIFIAQDGIAKFPNPKAVALMGYAEYELENLQYMNLVHPEDRHFIDQRKAHRKAGRDVPNTYSLRVINKNGDVVWVQLNTTPILWEGRPATINFLRDITEQKHLEEQLQQAQKMEAIGTLAGGIAHDFNNILSPIIGYAEMLQYEISSVDPAQQSIQGIIKAAHRARELIQQILAFSSNTDQAVKPMQIEETIKDSLKLLRASIPTTIEFDVDIDASATILGDPVQIQRVLMNLCTNAFHAMQPDGGRLGIRLKEVCIDTVTPPADLLPGQYLRLDISDTGHGIQAEDVTRIFDPYFTTKEKDKGTGLGLSVVHGIVTRHNGGITVKSMPGQGTVISIFLPVLNQPAESDELLSIDSIQTGNESILFVDDEEIVASVGRQVLESLGYKVTLRTSSAAALETFKKQPDAYDIVITDLTMPGLTGAQLAEQITRIRPGTPIILCTGYLEHLKEAETRRIGIQRLLRKPVSMQQYSTAIRSVLSKRQPERRHHPRFKPLSKIFAFTDTNPKRKGRIINISQSGMALQLDPQPAGVNQDEAFTCIDIMDAENSINLEKLPCRLIRNSSRHCAICFDALLPEKRKEIETLINNYTIGIDRTDTSASRATTH